MSYSLPDLSDHCSVRKQAGFRIDLLPKNRKERPRSKGTSRRRLRGRPREMKVKETGSARSGVAASVAPASVSPLRTVSRRARGPLRTRPRRRQPSLQPLLLAVDAPPPPRKRPPWPIGPRSWGSPRAIARPGRRWDGSGPMSAEATPSHAALSMALILPSPSLSQRDGQRQERKTFSYRDHGSGEGRIDGREGGGCLQG
jgi:hypothetical protein